MGDYFEESKIDIDLFNTFLATTWFHVLFHSFDVHYYSNNVENSKNKEKPLDT